MKTILAPDKPKARAAGRTEGSQQRVVGALARKLWTVAYKAACKAEPERYYGLTTWKAESAHPGRKAAWEAAARYVLKRSNSGSEARHE